MVAAVTATAERTTAARGPRSVWADTLDAAEAAAPPRTPLDGDEQVDVCIVGAGYTGLWTAYYLLQADPGLDVLVVEAETAGFGASGRNGGWVSALFPQSAELMARESGAAAAQAMRRAMRETVDEVGRVVEAEGIDCHWRKGGTVVIARTLAQLQRAHAEADADEAAGGAEGVRFLDARQACEKVRISGALGATFTPHCARVHPLRLARGLARAVERAGGRIVEGTRVTAIAPGEVRTERGTVRCRSAVRATEAWTSTLPSSRRDVVPVYSLMVATEPLPASFWERAGLAGGETFSDFRNVIVYGQRTADDRLAFGGRGAPYHFGSSIRPDHDAEPRVFDALRETVRELFPAIGDARFTHSWGGPLGIARDWHASVRHDPRTGLASAGGYVGDGVATTNLAGRTLADAVAGRRTPLLDLPWFGHTSPRWEPEPLRWTGVNAGLVLARAADAAERRRGRETPVGGLLGRLTGH
ncbi:NAD(P)/FAD-dependent oxidoreductase [Kineococcus rubinsiae]|uniref:NAD(P)/FAD-dependent oxidoreductase n=1 Tax=Kineococcus rubinsiae TaxID=2609562 RepID=UPI001AD926ED|nr:FAD-binding oxidoreductase [Kineococcus rubinsiae]